ncbi:MAG: AraC family transcriptional regulator [Defluviitaleaceae bacterium]|nr:AraC family transcriptional regulator [Defluviitaleaceae bacterium]
MENYTHFEHLSIATDIGIVVLDISGQILFESTTHEAASGFLQMLHIKMDCEESCRIAFVYGCYQARRFGGRYVFFAPSGLVYCAAPLLDNKGKMSAGVLAGPFILTDYDDFIEYDVKERVDLPQDDIDLLQEKVRTVPCISPLKAHSISEHLFYVASAYYSQTKLTEAVSVQTDVLSTAYPVEKEGELLSAISKGDIRSANEVLGDIIKQAIFHYGGNIELLRSRVVELTVLLSRAALKGGADINAILGLNYDYLKELDSFTSIEDIVLWLHMVTRRFAQYVFDFSGSKHMDIISAAVEYIKLNFTSKISLKSIADHLFISQQYFCRIFKEATGQTPGAYIAYLRIEESKKLLRKPNVNIVDIPEYVGFEGQSYFTKIFKKKTGLTPGQYRRENKVLPSYSDSP